MAGPSTRGSVFRTRAGYGIRWPEGGKRPQRTGFATRTAAREWFRDNVAPRLHEGAPDASITFNAFCDLYLDRWGATVAKRTKETVEERLVPSRDRFGGWTLRELEHAAADIAKWRAELTDSSRYRLTLAMRQTLNAAVRWRYLRANPVADAGSNPVPRSEEFVPFTRDEIDALDAELGPIDGPLVVFAAETGLRTNEWAALERRDVDKTAGAVMVQRRVADGVLTAFPKTVRSRRSVPLTTRALGAYERLPAQLGTRLVFPAPEGGYINLDNWRTRTWYDALDAAGIERRGPYHLRHTFATEALAAGVSIFELARVMGASVREIDRTYGHLARDTNDSIRARLDARTARPGVNLASGESSRTDG
jgi:integrase